MATLYFGLTLGSRRIRTNEMWGAFVLDALLPGDSLTSLLLVESFG